MTYETFRSLYWIHEILKSSIGIGTFAAILALFDMGADVDDPEARRRRRRCKNALCGALIVFLTVMGVVEYSGFANVNDAFGDGYTYVGQTVNGKADGGGRLFRSNGHMAYSGGFRSNRFSGEGTLFQEASPGDGDESTCSYVSYVGEFADGSPNGHGADYVPVRMLDYEYEGQEVEAAEILRYVASEGSAKPDVYSVTQSEEMEYVVAIGNARDDGIGPSTIPGGERAARESELPPVLGALRYEGEFSNGQWCGDGVEYFTAGRYKGQPRYEGAFVDGRYEGNGKQYEIQGDGLYRVYEGEFSAGQREGTGTWYYEGRKVYEGQFSNGMFNGEGTYYNEDGTSVSGTFVDNALVEE